MHALWCVLCAVPQIAANPLMLVPVTRLGEDAMLTIADSSDYAALGEELNFWQLMVSVLAALMLFCAS